MPRAYRALKWALVFVRQVAYPVRVEVKRDDARAYPLPLTDARLGRTGNLRRAPEIP